MDSLDTGEPVRSHDTQKVRPFMGQRVAGAIKHGSCGVSIVGDEIEGSRVPGCRVQPSRQDERRFLVCTRRGGRDFPLLPDSRERRFVRTSRSRCHVLLVPCEHFLGVDDEVVAERAIADLVRPDDDGMIRDVLAASEDRVDQCEPGDSVRLPRSYRLREICACGVTDQ